MSEKETVDLIQKLAESGGKSIDEVIQDMKRDAKIKLELSVSDIKDIFDALDTILKDKPISYDPEEYSMDLAYDYNIVPLEQTINVYLSNNGISAVCYQLKKNADDRNWSDKSLHYIFTIKENK